MPPYQSNNKRIAKNTIYLYVRMFFVLIVNLYISRVLLRALGVSDYGTYIIMAGLVTLFGFFNVTLSATMQRYYNYTGSRENEKGLQRVFSTGCVIHLIIAAATFMFLESFGLWYIDHYLVIPPERFNVALTVFHASAISLVLLILQSPCSGLMLSQERMGFYSFVSIADIMLKLAATLSLEHLPFDRLSTYALLLLCISATDLLLYAAYTKYNWKFLHLSRKIDRSLMRSLLSFTGWNLVGTFAFMLKGQGVNLLLNNFFGTMVNAARGIAAQVSSAIQNFSTSITVAFAPQIVNSVATDDRQRVEGLMFTESKICYALVLIIATPLCLEMDYVLNLWLGVNMPYQANIFSVLMIIDTLVCTLNTPCTQVTLATGKVKKYEIASSIVNLCLIPMCYVFLHLGFTAVSSFVITILFSILLQIVCLVFTHRVFKFNGKRYVAEVLLPCLCITIFLPIIPLLVKVSYTPTFLRLAAVCLVDLCIALPLTYLILLNKQEKKRSLSIIRYYKNRLRNDK
ncbi:hypothetical protein C7120_06850 [Prevotella sp. oral taxon 376]|uniref:hypothetical protein n=1 Tax=Prevotella sp. oral taxon 376 TaxID=712466 RepID=UPI000D1DEEBD|nr:hypothetical protein [Prevotella sp. oral taxon 376]PTL34250.1 hypothetical protein C7120_06850 [Prevotella sp. oral taxon 376]